MKYASTCLSILISFLVNILNGLFIFIMNKFEVLEPKVEFHNLGTVKKDTFLSAKWLLVFLPSNLVHAKEKDQKLFCANLTFSSMTLF